MIISIRHGFAFLCTPKGASTSVEAALRPFADLVIGGTPGLKHTNAREYYRFVKPLIEKKHPQAQVTTVCIMREPLEWVHSWYRYRAREQLSNPENPFHNNYTGNISFEQFVEELLSPAPRSFAKVGCQSTFFCDTDGSMLVDRIYPFPHLGALALFLAEKIGSPITLPHKNASQPDTLSLSPGLRERFTSAYARDYEIYQALI